MEAQAYNYLEIGAIKSYRENSFGLSMVELKENSTAIGMCGIIKRDYLEHPDIGFAFLTEFCGMGYAIEIVNATLLHANNKLNIQTVCAITVQYNVKSIALLEKAGMKFLKYIRIPNDAEELLLYSNVGLWRLRN